MNKSPLYNALVQYDNEKVYPFHMPGHKKRKGILESSGFDSIWMDVTEVPGMDNLYHAEGVIKEAQELAAKTFGSDETYFLVNGSTAGIITSILTVCSPGDEIIIARNCHRSAYSGMVLGDVRPVYIYPEMIKKYGIVGGISVKAVKEAILKHPKAKAVIITSPTYEGFTSNIKEIANLIHEYDKILIVDEAHGAHFVFDSNFPQTALNAGADLVIQSAHKTLPTLTQTALLHMKGKRVDKNRLKQMLSMIQTSSPSYVMMGMLDWCRGQLDERGTELFTRYMKQLQNMRTKLRKMNKVILVGEE
jgi:arginine/lysine/ornithine decarboxylase